MKICFLVPDLRPSGGVDVVLRHAEALRAEHGFEVDLLDAEPAADVEYDLAISTWWESAELLWRLRARRRLAFVQSVEEYFYDQHEPFERLGAALAFRAADGYLTVSSWLTTLVRELRPDAAVEMVHNGVDKTVFDGRRDERPGGPLRVLVEGQPSVWFKGVDSALRALSDVDVPIELTLVCRDPEEARGLDVAHVVGGLDPSGMADLYASSDVLVKLSSLEGLGLAPLEAFHHGVPCVVTPYGGHADYVRHGENGFLVGFDDPASVTRLVARLARDADLLARLRRGAYATAEEWPSAASSSARLAEALRSFGEGAQPPPQSLIQAWRATAEQHRRDLADLAWHEDALAETRGALDEQIAHVARLNDLVSEIEDHRQALMADLEAVQQSRAYRAAVGARSLLHKVRR